MEGKWVVCAVQIRILQPLFPFGRRPDDDPVRGVMAAKGMCLIKDGLSAGPWIFEIPSVFLEVTEVIRDV